VGDFEAMYQHAAEVPWHQDKTAFEVVAEVDLGILGNFARRRHWRRVLEVGCGLGYFTSRLASALPGAEVVGIDISPTAVEAARQQHAGIRFDVGDLRQGVPDGLGRFDVVVAKDLLWYVLPAISDVTAHMASLLNTGGCVYISQSVPNLPEFYGRDVFPSPMSIVEYFGGMFEMQYASSTYEKRVERAAGVYEMDKYARFLGQVKR
jgi:SAM-dependent methyltransferase